MKKIILLSVLLLLISACSQPKNDETLILEQISILESSIEQHNHSDFMDIVASNYHDPINNNKKSLQAMLLVYFLRFKDISVLLSNTTVEIHSIRTDAHSQVIITGGQGLIPDTARHYKVHSCWKKEADVWLLSCLEWQ